MQQIVKAQGNEALKQNNRKKLDVGNIEIKVFPGLYVLWVVIVTLHYVKGSFGMCSVESVGLMQNLM